MTHREFDLRWTGVSLLMAGLLAASAASGSTSTSPATAAGTPQAHEGGPVARVLEVTPRLGPPGTSVTVKAIGMPSLTPVQLALGATGGFEALALALTSIDGEVEGVLAVPDWAKRDETHRFIAFNLYFTAILAESPIFHVTDADGVVVRQGEVGRIGATCLTLEGDDEERYRLTGATGDLVVGERTLLEGVLTVPEAPTEGCGDEPLPALQLR